MFIREYDSEPGNADPFFKKILVKKKALFFILIFLMKFYLFDCCFKIDKR